MRATTIALLYRSYTIHIRQPHVKVLFCNLGLHREVRQQLLTSADGCNDGEQVLLCGSATRERSTYWLLAAV